MCHWRVLRVGIAATLWIIANCTTVGSVPPNANKASSADVDSDRQSARIIYAKGFSDSDVEKIVSNVERLHRSSSSQSAKPNWNRLASAIDTYLALLLNWSAFAVSVVNSTLDVGWSGEAQEAVLLFQTEARLTVLIIGLGYHSDESPQHQHEEAQPSTFTDESSKLQVWGFEAEELKEVERILQRSLTQLRRRLQKRALLVAEGLCARFPHTRFDVLLTSSRSHQFIGFHSSAQTKFGVLANALKSGIDGQNYAVVVVGVASSNGNEQQSGWFRHTI